MAVGDSLLTVIDRNNKWTQIYAHTKRTCSPAPKPNLLSSSSVKPDHLKSPYIPLYFFQGPGRLLRTSLLPEGVQMENKSRQVKPKNSKINTRRVTLPKSTQVTDWPLQGRPRSTEQTRQA